MRADSFLGQLTLALGRQTPAFRPLRGSTTSIGQEIITALGRSSAAFLPQPEPDASRRPEAHLDPSAGAVSARVPERWAPTVGNASLIPIRFDRLLAAAASAGDERPTAQQIVYLRSDVVAELYSGAGVPEIEVAITATGGDWHGKLLAITAADDEGPATTYLLVLTGGPEVASGRVTVAARSDAPTVSITLSARTTDSLGADDAPAVRRSVASSTGPGMHLWLDLADRLSAIDPVAQAIREGLK